MFHVTASNSYRIYTIVYNKNYSLYKVKKKIGTVFFLYKQLVCKCLEHLINHSKYGCYIITMTIRVPNSKAINTIKHNIVTKSSPNINKYMIIYNNVNIMDH